MLHTCVNLSVLTTLIHGSKRVQTWPSSVVLNWVRAIRHFSDNDTTPLNVTTVNTADIVSTLRVPACDA